MSHKLINALLAGALLLTGSATFAQTTPEPASLLVGVYETAQAEKICVAVVKPANTVAYVQLLASTGEALYLAHLPRKDASFRQVIDLHKLEDGTYSLRIKQGSSTVVKSIQLQTNRLNPTVPMRFLTLSK